MSTEEWTKEHPHTCDSGTSIPQNANGTIPENTNGQQGIHSLKRERPFPITRTSIPRNATDFDKENSDKENIEEKSASTVPQIETGEGLTTIDLIQSAHACVAAWDFAYKKYKNKFHESPNWFKKDRAELDALFSRKPELTLDEFKKRWTFYLKSTDPFYARNGFGLGFFCKHAFDALRDGPQNERGRDAEEKPYGGLTRKELERRRSELSPEAQRLYAERGIRPQ